MLPELLPRLARGETLTREESRDVMGEILRGEATPSQIAAFVTALALRGETVEEIAGCAEAMRNAMVRVRAPAGSLDTCGTGGDGKGTFNISTVTALVCAGAGIPVAKHGNRAASSRCGSADLLEALGVRLDPPPATVEKCLREAGIAFLFAPKYHPALRHAAPVRKELGFRTVFNLLGPLCNPAGVEIQLLGVPRRDLVDPIARVLQSLGTRRSWVVHSADGCDELSPSGESVAREVTPDAIRELIVHPRDAGLEPEAELPPGGDPAVNRDAALAVLRGDGGPFRTAVILNAAACLVLARRAPSLREGAAIARERIDDGSAARALDRLRAISHEG